MKKVFVFVFAAIAVCFFSNEAFAQQKPNKIQDVSPDSFVNPNQSANTAVIKIQPVKKQELINTLYQRLDLVNASTTLTAAQKQELIDKINARLAELE